MYTAFINYNFPVALIDALINNLRTVHFTGKIASLYPPSEKLFVQIEVMTCAHIERE